MTEDTIFVLAGILPIAATLVSLDGSEEGCYVRRTNTVARPGGVLKTIGQGLTRAKVDEVGIITEKTLAAFEQRVVVKAHVAELAWPSAATPFTWPVDWEPVCKALAAKQVSEAALLLVPDDAAALFPLLLLLLPWFPLFLFCLATRPGR